MNLLGELKRVTGFNGPDIAKEFGITSQWSHEVFRNTSMVHVNSQKYMVLTMADKRIKELKNQIEEIEKFKEGVKEL